VVIEQAPQEVEVKKKKTGCKIELELCKQKWADVDEEEPDAWDDPVPVSVSVGPKAPAPTDVGRALAETNKTPAPTADADEWTDVVSKKKKRDPSDTQGKGGHTASAHTPPWKGQPRQPRQNGTPAGEDRFAALRPDSKAEATPQTSKNRNSKDHHGTPVARDTFDRFAGGDKFEALRNEPKSEATPQSRRKDKDSSFSSPATGEKSSRFSNHDAQTPSKNAGDRPARRNVRSEEAGPNRKKKDDVKSKPSAGINDDPKSKAKEEILAEIEIFVADGDSLLRADFDMRSRQYLHAIHQKGGREKVHVALQVIHATTRGKSRDSVQNWQAYVCTLLRCFFNDLKADMADAATAASPKLEPSDSPPAPNALPDFAPPLR
jgi:hypothetical protein